MSFDTLLKVLPHHRVLLEIIKETTFTEIKIKTIF